MNDPQDIREESWRRKLTSAEEAEIRAWLGQHPEERADWEADLSLNQALDQLPPAVVPSNFTARVLQAVERENAREKRDAGLRWNWRTLAPRLGLAAIALVLGLFSYGRYQAGQRSAWAHELAVMSDVADVSNPDVLQDFDQISRLARAASADEDLLTLFDSP